MHFATLFLHLIAPFPKHGAGKVAVDGYMFRHFTHFISFVLSSVEWLRFPLALADLPRDAKLVVNVLEPNGPGEVG